jgi:hypothetical protein
VKVFVFTKSEKIFFVPTLAGTSLTPRGFTVPQSWSCKTYDNKKVSKRKSSGLATNLKIFLT